MRKWYVLFFAVVFSSGSLFAQTVTVIATSGTASATYSTLKACFDAINAGTHQGTITIDVNGNITETAAAVLNASGSGASSYTSILIKPTGPASITCTLFGFPVIDLNGAKNVTIDGRIDATGTTRTLILRNLSTSNNSGTSTIRFRNDAENDVVNYVNLEGSSRGIGTGTIFIGTIVGSIGNRQIQITNNDIGAAGANIPFNAIYSGGTAAAPNNFITVSSNLIHDYFNPTGQSIGIFCSANNTGWTVSNNSLFQTATRTITGNPSGLTATQYAIVINSGNDNRVSNNFIGGSAINAGGSPTIINGSTFKTYFRGIFMNVGTTTASSVDGNLITNIQVSSTAAVAINLFAGIDIFSGKVNIGVGSGNTIGALTGTGSIVCTPSNTNSTFIIGIATGSGTQVDIRYNSIGSITVNGSSAGQNILRGINSQDNASVNILNNTIGGITANSMQVNSPNGGINGIILFSNANGQSAEISNNTISNLLNNGVEPHGAYIFGIHNTVRPNITMTTTINNNIIRNFNSPSPGSFFGYQIGIFLQSDPTSSSDATITGNVISGFNSASTGTGTQVIGIEQEARFNNFMHINNNTIHGLTTASTYKSDLDGVTQGINAVRFGTGDLNMIGNTIYDLESTTTGDSTSVIGIGSEYGGPSATISRNRIYDLRNPNAMSSGLISGMHLRGVDTAGNFNITNNIISLSPASVQTYGIRNNRQASQINLYYNSVAIAGNASGNHNSAAFSRHGDTVGTPIYARNNIFYNTRTGGTGMHYAITNNNNIPSTGWPATASDYNNLLTNDPATIALWGTSSLSLPAFQSASGGDAHSKTVAVTFVNAPMGDLHLTGASIGDNNLGGIPVPGVTEDFDGNQRNQFKPYIGIDEIVSAPLPIRVEYIKGSKQGSINLLDWKASCTSPSMTFEIQRSSNGRNFETIGGFSATRERCAQPFDFIDHAPANGINYYRLSMTEEDGKVYFSIIVAIINNDKRFLFSGLMPSIVKNETVQLNVSSSEKIILDITISNASGAVVKRDKAVIEPGSNTLSFNFNALSSGIYQLTGYSQGAVMGTVRFVKQ